nr:helix-turn-helix domain-containing protein [uncultured Prevotella sp.]
MELSELSSFQEASLFTSHLEEWQDGPQVITYGAILICRRGKAMLIVNYKDWEMYEGAVITVFPNDVVELKVKSEERRVKNSNAEVDDKASFEVEILKYNASLLREASLQLEQTVYSSLREDRCRQDSPVVTHIINSMFSLLKVYFNQSECTCISQLVLLQLKAFFVGFHEYLQRNPQFRPEDEVKSYRVRELFNRFMMLMERDYKQSRDVNYYANLMHITSKYLTNIVRQVTGHTPKTIIDQYVILQLKMQLQRTSQSIKEIAWEYHFTDVSFFCRYFKKHTGLTPQQVRE